MRKKKICMVGEFAVGKTSLTQKFVNNVFSDKYLTTVGVKIDTVVIKDTKLVVWDIAGRDSLSPINANYLVGAVGVILVADGTRPQTIDAIANLKAVVEKRIGVVAMSLAINKHDDAGWAVSQGQLEMLAELDLEPVFTSAKDGSNIETLFSQFSVDTH